MFLELHDPRPPEDETVIFDFMPRLLEDIQTLLGGLDGLRAQVTLRDTANCLTCLDAYRSFLDAKMALVSLYNVWDEWARDLTDNADAPWHLTPDGDAPPVE